MALAWGSSTLRYPMERVVKTNQWARKEAAMTKFVISIILLVIVVLFVIQNTEVVEVQLLFWTLHVQGPHAAGYFSHWDHCGALIEEA